MPLTKITTRRESTTATFDHEISSKKIKESDKKKQKEKGQQSEHYENDFDQFKSEIKRNV
jgi:hypothetical protein